MIFLRRRGFSSVKAAEDKPSLAHDFPQGFVVAANGFSPPDACHG